MKKRHVRVLRGGYWRRKNADAGYAFMAGAVASFVDCYSVVRSEVGGEYAPAEFRVLWGDPGDDVWLYGELSGEKLRALTVCASSIHEAHQYGFQTTICNVLSLTLLGCVGVRCKM